MSETIQRNRISSIDILRGLVILLMGIDHTRDMFAATTFNVENINNTTVGFFFTRFITHFCAPVFVFLAGTSSFLYLQKIKSKNELSKFLLKRGVWLILIEIFIINISWSWTFIWNSWGFFLQVIWLIGVAMICLAALIHLSDKLIFIISTIVIAGHNLLDGIKHSDLGSFYWLWKILHQRGWIGLADDNSFGISIIYPLLPWVGVIGFGYLFGKVMLWETKRRKQMLMKLGLIGTGSFILLRFINLYGDPSSWQVRDTFILTVMDFLNTEKYPPSLLFILMTIGPPFFLLILFEKWSNKLLEILRLFGRVPFFYYIVHIPLIHLSSVLYFKIVHGEWFDMYLTSQKNWPDFYEPSLPRMYLAWFVISLILYFLCKWFNTYKSTHNYWWLKYL